MDSVVGEVSNTATKEHTDDSNNDQHTQQMATGDTSTGNQEDSVVGEVSNTATNAHATDNNNENPQVVHTDPHFLSFTNYGFINRWLVIIIIIKKRTITTTTRRRRCDTRTSMI